MTAADSADEGLKNCPFCGHDEPKFSGSQAGSNFHCVECLTDGPFVHTDDWKDATKAWNRRATPAPAPAPSAEELSAEEIDAFCLEVEDRLNASTEDAAMIDRLRAQAKRAMPAGGAGAVPVAWRYRYIFEDGPSEFWHFTDALETPSPDKEIEPLYASPIGAGERETIEREVIERCAQVCDCDGADPNDIAGGQDGIDLCQSLASAIRALSATGGDK